jgi:tetratricopeptide (TPR) repeat protein
MKLTFINMSFSELMEQSEELTEIREEYAHRTPEEIRKAASFQYDSTIASSLFNDALSRVSSDQDEPQPDWPGEVTALAIDPEFAPAILSVGSYEYSYGRIPEAMEHFFYLASISEESEPDIDKIIEKAADFLCNHGSHDKAIELVLYSSKNKPSKAIYHDLLAYYYGKVKDFKKAVNQGRIAVLMEPDNYEFLSNYGWSLIESGYYDVAKKILTRAVELAPKDYQYAKGNLEELSRRRKNKNKTK